MGNWNSLSQYEKADIMKLALQNGIYDLNDIRSIYNEYAEGGDKGDDMTRVKRADGSYAYVKTKNGHAITNGTGRYDLYDSKGKVIGSGMGDSFPYVGNVVDAGTLDEITVTPNGVQTQNDSYDADALFKAAQEAERNKEIARNRAIDAKVSQYAFTPEGFFGQALQPTNLLSPTHTTRALWNMASGDGYGNVAQDLFMPNSGWFSDEFAKEHPYWTMAGNMLGDALAIGTGAALYRMPKYRAALQAENRASQEITNNVKRVAAEKSLKEMPWTKLKRKKAEKRLLEETKKYAELGRQDLIDDVDSQWYRERVKNAVGDNADENTINRIIADKKKLAEEVPFDYSKTVEELEGYGDNEHSKWLEYTSQDGRPVTDYHHTNTIVHIAKDIGKRARQTGFHEGGHYSMGSAHGLEPWGSNVVLPEDPLDFAAVVNNDEIIIPRGKSWQGQFIDYNERIMPTRDSEYQSFMPKRFEAEENPGKVKSELIAEGKTPEEADVILQKMKDADYMWGIQEQDRHLKQFFHYKVKPLVKNPNDADEIEKVLTEHPELVEKGSRIEQLMRVLRPGTNKDWAKALAGLLSTLPIVNSVTNK